MTQFIGTCWFNSIFNTLLLSEKCYNFFNKKYNELSETDRARIETSSPQETNTDCLVTLKRHHFFQLFQKYKLTRRPANIIARGLQLFKTRKDPTDLINKMGIRDEDPGWEKDSKKQCFDPYIALQRILPIILNTNEYTILDLAYGFDLWNDQTRLNPAPLPKELQLIIIGQTEKNILSIDVDEIEQDYRPHIEDFELDHANIVVYSKWGIGPNPSKTIGHAFAGYKCNGEYYVYDSNEATYFKLDWRKRANVAAYFDEHYKLARKPMAYYSYLCYMRKGSVNGGNDKRTTSIYRSKGRQVHYNEEQCRASSSNRFAHATG